MISQDFELLLTITVVVWGGFFVYLSYIFARMNKLKKELSSLKTLEHD